LFLGTSLIHASNKANAYKQNANQGYRQNFFHLHDLHNLLYFKGTG
jgi:hypothetical protein